MKPLYSDGDRGRVYTIEDESDIGLYDKPLRSEFRRDNGRLIHSAVFRRLQGKTQLFPNYESDFFRNRLTHSLEVAQIAKGIAEQINAYHPYFLKYPIDTDIVETVALAHDLGHPPFGHNGEKALDDMMKCSGGFEGNAQTLRILSKLEKKSTIDGNFSPVIDGRDFRCGLNLTYRTLAGILKYDKEIPIIRNRGDKLVKGYYYTEKNIVQRLNENVIGTDFAGGKLKTVECKIMDIADDIAYSTYDMEDAFKAEFLSPLAILSSDPDFIRKLAKSVSEGLKDIEVSEKEINKILAEIYGELFDEENIKQNILSVKSSGICDETKLIQAVTSMSSTEIFDFSKRICVSGYFRTKHTSQLVKKFMSGVAVGKINNQSPALSEICFEPEIRKQVEVLKRYTYNAVIESPRLKIAEFRGYDVVRDIFQTIIDEKRKGFNLLPEDFRRIYDSLDDVALKKRVVCDFIAGMTDKYAIEFYCRLKSETPQTIFKPF